MEQSAVIVLPPALPPWLIFDLNSVLNIITFKHQSANETQEGNLFAKGERKFVMKVRVQEQHAQDSQRVQKEQQAGREEEGKGNQIR